MAHKTIGQETFGFEGSSKNTSLDDLSGLLDWSKLEELLSVLWSSPYGEKAWPPLAMFKGLLLSRWYNLSDVKLAECMDDRASFRRFCGFSRTEATPERTAYVRFRKALVEHNLSERLFEEVTRQMLSQHLHVEEGTIIDATIIQSASKEDEQARWIKHKNKPAVHGYKAHVSSGTKTDLIKRIHTTPANMNDGKTGPYVIPDTPGDVFADSAYRGGPFKQAVEAKGGRARVVATGVYAKSDEEAKALLAQINGPIHKVRGRIEKIFGTCKSFYGMRRMSYWGLAKANLEICFCAMAYNIKRGLSLHTA